MNLFKYIIFISIVFTSCINNSSCNQVRLTKKEKQWFDFYSEGDTLIFGNANKELKFYVKSKSHDFTACNKFELGPNEYEYIGTTLKSPYFKIRINFTKEFQDTKEPDCHKNIYVSDLYSDNITNLGVLKQEPVYVPYLNKEISTYLITSDTLTIDIDGGNQYVRSFNWSEKYGVVRYTRFNNEVFTLMKKK